MTRNGKIARMPKAIRDELNQKLEDGVPGVQLVDWLNWQPEVQDVLTNLFDGRPINESNLSEWKCGGFLDWQARQDMRAHAQELVEESEDLKAALPAGLTEHLQIIVTGRYAELLNKWNGEVDERFMRQLKGLRLLCQDVALLRRGDLAVGQQALRVERLALERERAKERAETKGIQPNPSKSNQDLQEGTEAEAHTEGAESGNDESRMTNGVCERQPVSKADRAGDGAETRGIQVNPSKSNRRCGMTKP